MTKVVHSKKWEKSTKKKPEFFKHKQISEEEMEGKKSKFSPEKKKSFKQNTKNLKFKKKFTPMKSNSGKKFENSKIKKNFGSEELSQNETCDLSLQNKPKKFIKKFDSEKPSSEEKSFKRKSDETEETPAAKKHKMYNMKFKERKLFRKTHEPSKKEKVDVVKKLKLLWEELRPGNCEREKKKKLLNQICGSVKGHVKEYVFAHDTVRILECVVAEGNDTHRALVFHEIKDDIVLLSKSKYAKYILMKILKHGSKEQKEAIMNSFQGVIPQLVKHTHAAQVVEMAFNECAAALQRFSMVQEFFGASYRHFKELKVNNLTELLQQKPEARASIITSMKEELMKVLEKSVVKHSLVHNVLLQFFLNCDAASRSEIIQSLRDVVPEILHTKDGSRVAMHCVWHGTYLDRKVIIKHMKTFVKKIAMEEYGHMVLLALFDCVDDTFLIEKIIIKELKDNMLEVAQNMHGKKVLVYLLSPRDPLFFHPDIVNILKSGDDNENSKKNPEVRRKELKETIAEPLRQLIFSNISELYKNNAFCLLTVAVLKHTAGDKTDAFEAVAKMATEPYTAEDKNVHIIENPGTFFMLKHLIMNDAQEKATNSVTFSEVLVNTVPDGVMKTWFFCNRGAFLLVHLLETEIPAVVNRVKTELTGRRKKIEKMEFVGAEILLKKLRKLDM